MSRTIKYSILIASFVLVAWSVTSLALGSQLGAKKYGAGSPNDTCDDWCYTTFKYFVECYHEVASDPCLTNSCILNTMKAAACDPITGCSNDCPYAYWLSEWYMYQLARRNTSCSTPDPSPGFKTVVTWDECEYAPYPGEGRCFTGSCTGDYWKQRHRWHNYKCRN
jgi:hypothetical protein